jgi:hypothetical protein
MPERPQRRVRFVQAELQRLSAAACMARVELERREAGGYVGTAVASEAEGLRATAKAAADALMQAAASDHVLEVHDVKLLNVFGKLTVVVQVGAKQQERWVSLMGFCVAGQDPTRAAALAVLHATNRVLDAG